jgi:hypothetical protein
MTQIRDAEESLVETLSYNLNWYQTKSKWNKYLHLTLQGAVILLPLVTMIIEINFHIVTLNLVLLLLVSILSAANLTLGPQQNWQRFKQAEMDLTVIKLRFDVQRSDPTLSDADRRALSLEILESAANVIKQHASKHFMDIEERLGKRL